MKFKTLNGVLIVDILSTILILAIIFIPSNVLRIILGLPFLLFFPGYTLVAALFIQKDPIESIEKIALSCGMSIAIVALIGFGLNYTSWGIRLEPVLYSITAFMFLMSVIALFKRARILRTSIFTREYNIVLPGWSGSIFNKSLSIILIIVIFGAIGVLAYTIVAPKIGERFTEFYILGLHGQAEDYPTNFVLENGQVTQIIYNEGTIDTISRSGKVTLGIVNHEQQTMTYYLLITINNEPVDFSYDDTMINILGPIELVQGEKWENVVGFIPRIIGDDQKVEFQLLESDKQTVINSLHLWIDVR